jgi:putative oxidoreductase
MSDWLQLVARLLLAQIFLGAGVLQLAQRDATLQQIATRVSGPLVPLFLVGAVLVELIGGAALVVGFRATWAAALLAAWVLAATTLYHTDFRQPFQADLFAKDLAIAGGLLLVAAFGAGRISLDALLGF